MRASLASREPQRLARWQAQDAYGQRIRLREGAQRFILHDGPPYANGALHMGHALNKTLKDVVLRYKHMRGFQTPYIPGWDCHGLPIEQQVLRKVGDKIHTMEPLALRKLCHDYALGWVDKQREQFQRLGILGDWHKPYLTLDPAFEVGILKVLGELVQRGLVRQGFRTVHWDPVFRTALAEAEIEYHPHRSPSIYVKMPFHEAAQYPPFAGLERVSFVIWTTTPWTIPANLGITLHPEFPYAVVRTAEGEHLIVAEGLRERFLAACGLENTQVVATFQAPVLDKARAEHPLFPGQASLVMLGEHVTLEQGTGCVHTAPGHGADDFLIGQRYGLPAYSPVNAEGRYTAEYPAMEGLPVFESNPKVIDALEAVGALLARHEVEHEYPYSWRSKQPIIFRATAQWFVELAEGGIRQKALEAIDNAVEWIPRWGYDRIRAMVEHRPEWCISRQRHWGVPIPAIRHIASDEALLLPEVVERFTRAVAERGTNAWYDTPLSAFLPEGMDAEAYTQEYDILDVWFDSGASHTAVLKADPRVSYPADLYLEGSDQHRGWFQSALLLGCGVHDQAPYKAVLTHGFLLDEKGEAMSKSKGNSLSPLDLIEVYGADVLRLWVASTDYRQDVAVSEAILKQIADSYRSMRNTLRFQLGNLHDFDPKQHLREVDTLRALDQWALHELAGLIDTVTAAMERYEFHRAYQALNLFVGVQLSARYHDFLKDRLYTYAADDPERRSAQVALYHHFTVLVKLLAPFLVFTADEAWEEARQHFPALEAESVHDADWPVAEPSWHRPELGADFAQLLTLRDQVNEQLEALRAQKQIGKSLDARVLLTAPEASDVARLWQAYAQELPELLVVSEVQVSLSPESKAPQIHVEPSPYERCPRCWRRVKTFVDAQPEPVCERCAQALQALQAS